MKMTSSEGATTTRRKLSVIQGDSASGKQFGDSRCLTFILEGEDHTFGNSLRYLIMKNPEVEFCGYNVPHPTESRINFRIQSRGPPAVSILKQGIQDLSQVCDHVLATFEESVKEYKSEAGDPMET